MCAYKRNILCACNVPKRNPTKQKVSSYFQNRRTISYIFICTIFEIIRIKTEPY